MLAGASGASDAANAAGVRRQTTLIFRLSPHEDLAALEPPTLAAGILAVRRKGESSSARYSRLQEERLRSTATAVTHKRASCFSGPRDVDVLASKLRRCVDHHLDFTGNSSARSRHRTTGAFRPLTWRGHQDRSSITEAYRSHHERADKGGGKCDGCSRRNLTWLRPVCTSPSVSKGVERR